MSDIDPLTGLPKELGVFEDIARENQTINVYNEKRRFGKMHTIIGGLDNREINLKDLTKKFKMQFATGGTVKNGTIELHGDFSKKVIEELVSMGFDSHNITLGKQK